MTITASGDVAGLVYFDRNGNGEPDADDSPFAGVEVALALTAHDLTVARATTAGDGIFWFSGVPVGEYRFEFQHPAIGDTIFLTALNPARVRVQPGDSIPIRASITYPFATIASFRNEVPQGRKVFVDGVALNAWQSFSDSTVHIAGASGYLRATLVRPVDVIEDDSVRLLGTRRTVNGQPVIDDVRIYRIARGVGGWLAKHVGSGTAASADGGALDAALVRISGAEVADSADVVGRYRRFVVDDGSGPLEVFIENVPAFQIIRPGPGDRLDLTGLLAPAPDGASWRLRPRRPEDIRPSS